MVVAHSCVCSWWTAVRGGDASAEWDAYRRAVRDGLRAADGCRRAVGGDAASAVGALRRGRTARWCRMDATRRSFSTGPKEPLVLSAGRLWDEAKNVDCARVDCASPALARGARRRDAGRCWRRATPERCGRVSRASAVGRAARVDGPRIHLRHAGALRAVRPVDSRGGALGLRAGARRHPEPARALGRRRGVRRARRSRRAARCDRAADRRPGAAGGTGPARAGARPASSRSSRMVDAYRAPLRARLLAPSQRRALEVSSCAS